jgi:cycloartenol synthase
LSHVVSEKATPKFQMTGETAGRQIWYQETKQQANEETEFEFNPSKNVNSGDKVIRHIRLDKWKGPKPSKNTPKTASEAVEKATSFYQMLQCDDGHWPGDYGGPMFLMPGLICVLYLTKSLGSTFPQYKINGMIDYLKNHQQLDGGWGTHIECASTMFGTVLSYVSLRLLGVSPHEDFMILGRQFIHEHGGALYAPSWAKFWLATLGVYDWEGINSIPAELWLLPRWFPFHPGKMWCHSRMVYLPMGYVYGKRFVPEMDDTLLSLRKELYTQDYASIHWDSTRQLCADIDVYSPLNPVLKLAQDFLSVYERFVLPYLPGMMQLRTWGLDFVIDYIHAEDLQTNFVDIGPVNKALNMLAVYVHGNCDRNNENFQRHIPRVDDYLWIAEDGMKMQGYNGCQAWDTAFATQAIVEAGLASSYSDCLKNAYIYLKRSQIAKDEDDREYYFRQVSKGGWPFSTSAHGWPISDCTAEGLKAVLAMHRYAGDLVNIADRIPKNRLQDAVDVILSLHNSDGGWATYENNRGHGWYEMLNPSEVFGDIMIDYSYVECTSACITALLSFSKDIPHYKTAQVRNAIRAGVKFLKSIQRNDGSWYGSWAVCFLYGTWFGVEGLIAAGEAPDSYSVRKATEFIISKQNPNGGWGESYVACVNKAYPYDGTGEVSCSIDRTITDSMN